MGTPRISTKKRPTKDHLSREDWDLLEHNWYCEKPRPNGTNKIYYWRRKENKKTVIMHRIVGERMLGSPICRGHVVDHIDYDGLNNRRDNLRICSVGDNISHQRLNKRNTSGIRGVTFDTGNNCWISQISYKGRRAYIGRYKTQREAFVAYDAVARILFKRFYDTNISIDDLNTPNKGRIKGKKP